MLQPWRTGKVIRILDETQTTRRFWIEVPEVENFDFKPGQFVTLDLPIHEKPNKRWRSYSIASWPDGSNIFELVIVLLEGGLGTAYLFNEVRVGSELTLRGPQGVFTLPESIDRDLFLICTGTGIAPFRAMTHHILNHNIDHQNIYLVFGCRLFSDCLYGQELKAMEKELKGYQYIPTFSREDPGEHRSGYVHSIYEEIISREMKTGTDNIPTEANGNLKPAYFYLCGWKNMIDEAKQRLLSIGYDKKAIHLELYG